ncbi:hypothetical protein B0H19DRAFT_1080794 [Mycena capillaripes]|nr:hypothetical protein B0H19DRAFT_1080794 [Mycena capillaripes]
MKFISIAFALSLTAPALAATVTYCTGLSLAGTRFTSSPADGACVNVDLSVNDQTHSAQIEGGNSMQIAAVITPTSWMAPSTTSTPFVVVAGRSVSLRSNVAPEALQAPDPLCWGKIRLDILMRTGFCSDSPGIQLSALSPLRLGARPSCYYFTLPLAALPSLLCRTHVDTALRGAVGHIQQHGSTWADNGRSGTSVD